MLKIKTFARREILDIFEGFINKYPKGLSLSEIHRKIGTHKVTIVKYMDMLVKKKRAKKFNVGNMIMYSPYHNKL